LANIRQQIVDELTSRMASITTANGYSASIKKVQDWGDPRAIEEADMPAIMLRDSSDTMPQDSIGHGRRDHELSLFLVVAFAGGTPVASCREMLADMLTAIGTDATFGELAYDCEPLNAELMPDEANKKVGYGQIVLNIRYRSDLWDM